MGLLLLLIFAGGAIQKDSGRPSAASMAGGCGVWTNLLADGPPVTVSAIPWAAGWPGWSRRATGRRELIPDRPGF